MKKTLFIIGAFVLCHTSFGQTTSILPGLELNQRSNELYADYDFFIPLENLEKNNSYDGPMSIDEYSVTGGVTNLAYTHEFTYTPAGVLVSITKYDAGMNALQRKIYARDIEGRVTSIVFMQDVAGTLKFDQRVIFEYNQGYLVRQLDEIYNLGTWEWEFDQLTEYEFIGGYQYPSEILFTYTDAASNIDQQKIKYLYGSNNKPTFLGVYYYDDNYQAWIPNQEWTISDWGPTEFKSDFAFGSYLIPTSKPTDFITGKADNYALYPASVTLQGGYDLLTETFTYAQSIHSSVYDAQNNRTQFYVDEVTSAGSIPASRIDATYDPCYGFRKSLQYNYSGTYDLSFGQEFAGETTPYLNSCYVNAYNVYGSFNSGNPTGTWNKRYEINHQSNLSVDESEASLFEVYPNPTSGEVTIQSISDEKAHLKITDLMGKTMFEKELYGSVNTLNLNELPNGIYTIEYTSNGSLETSRFVKQ